MNEETKKKKHKQSFTLTLIFFMITFLVQAIAVVVSGFVVYILVQVGVFVNIKLHSDALLLVVFITLTSLILGIGTAFLSSRISMRPVNKLIGKMNQLASGDFKTRISYGRPFGRLPVIEKLTDSFNTMAEELENTEMLRSDFINNFSHEFKTPIVSIAGFTKLLKRGNLTEEQKAEYLDIIEEESMRLSSIATNVLNLTKVENQMILSDLSEYNLSEQIRSCVLILERKWEKKDLVFCLEFEEHRVIANKELMKQVWINLIDNAIKFSPQKGWIKIQMKDTGNQISVSISNTGSTVPEEKQKKIFSKFYQVDESHATEGNGIGLAVVKHIVQLHQGTVTVRSGSGVTTFMVSLPKKILRNKKELGDIA